MEQTLRFTHIQKGILRMRRSDTHAPTLAERYGLLSAEAGETSGIAIDGDAFVLPDGRRLAYRLLNPDSEEYDALHRSLSEEFAEHFTDYQVIIGAPPENETQILPQEMLPDAQKRFAIALSLHPAERFYGLGEASRERTELRGHAYQNWVRYQYNEIPIPLLLSSDGWGVFLNARARTFMDIGKRNPDELLILGENDELDLFLLTGDSMQEMLRLYTSLTGAPMVLPKWAYGLTYIAPIFSTQETVLNHAERLRKHHIPCDHISLEPGWMEKFYDYSTTKHWAEERFHMPDWMPPHCERSFLSSLRRYGFHTSLWLCVRHDLTAEAERQLVGGDPADYPEAWFRHLEPLVDQDVEGFKLDPADTVCCFDHLKRPRLYNGLTAQEMHNLNQLLLPKQMYEGYASRMNRRPMHHYCGGYSGIQKWSASTTGDNGGELGAMIWLETLALSGHSNTTIDMNLHHPESLHFGMFVPWAHLNAWSGTEQPWWAGNTQYRMFVEYARLRYRLIPYLYAAALQAHEESVPMVRPMPLSFPEDPALYSCTGQYMLGDSLLITAYTNHVHLPAGRWTDAWTGETHVGPCDLTDYQPPVGRGGGLFIRGGAIIPTWRDRDYVGQYDDSEIFLNIFPAGSSSCVFREDDGVSLDYETRPACRTEISVQETERYVSVRIGRRDGEYSGKPETRVWRIRVHTDLPVVFSCDEADRVIPERTDALETFHTDASDLFR